MNINPAMANYYEQKSPFPAMPKQTQSNPIKPNPASVFEPKIGFEHSKPATIEHKCECFLRSFTKKYTLLEKFMLFFNPFSHFERGILFKCNPAIFPVSQGFTSGKAYGKTPKFENITH